MDSYAGYIYQAGELSETVNRRIKNDIKFTDNIILKSWGGSNYEIFLILTNDKGAIAYSLVRKSTAVTTGKLRIEFEKYVLFPNPISEGEIYKILESSELENFNLNRLEVDLWKLIRTRIIDLFPSIESEIVELENFQKLRDYIPTNNARSNLIFERDATNLALRMAKLEEMFITEWNQNEGEEIAPFLKGLSSVSIREDTMIIHDSRVFGDWEFSSGVITGAIELKNKSQRLTLMNVNRLPLEETLGVDLIYYFHKYQSYVMVQYKRKIFENGKFVYKPNNKSYQSEYDQMNLFNKSLSHTPDVSELSDYRLNHNLFYFKFCAAQQFDPRSSEMIEGEYVPLELWETFIKSPEALGSQGGIKWSGGKSGRHLSNTDFINLAGNGWLGTRVANASIISDIIRESLAAGKSVTLAENFSLRD